MCCWKHGYASPRCSGHFTAAGASIILVRSPYPWVLSMKENSYGMEGANGGGSLREFLNSPVSDAQWHKVDPLNRSIAVADMPLEEVGSCYPDTHENVLQLWNAKVSSYLELLHVNRLKRESSAAGEGSAPPAALIANLSNADLYDLDAVRDALLPFTADGRFQVRHPSGKIVYPEFEAKEDKFAGHFTEADFKEAAAYERDSKWLELFTQDDLDFVNSQIDPWLMAAFGLDIVTSVRAGPPSSDSQLDHAPSSVEEGVVLDTTGVLRLRDLEAPAPAVAATSSAEPLPQRTREWHARMLTFMDATL